MTAHTKGPWIAAAAGSSIVGWPVVAPGGRSICKITWTPKTAIGEGFTAAEWEAFNAECKANAHLIGAAPDLLAELKNMTLLFKAALLCTSVEIARDAKPHIAAAEAAIAKAVSS